MAAAASTNLNDFLAAAGAAASVVKSVNSESSLLASIVAQTTLSPSTSSSTSHLSFSSSLSAATASSTLSSIVSNPATTLSSTFSNKPKRHVSQEKLAIGVVVPTVGIAVLLFGLWAWRKRRRRNLSTVVEKRSATPSEEIQPYLQQKAELEDEARRRHGLEAQEQRYEKDGNEIYELPERHSRHAMPERHSGRSLQVRCREEAFRKNHDNRNAKSTLKAEKAY